MAKKNSTTELARFESYISRTDTCWLWTGGKKAAGYGHFSVFRDGRWGKAIAHRYAYQVWVGPIPDTYEVDHVCRNRGCVRPDHLEAITLAENRHRRNEHRTHCRNGHPYNEANTRMQLYPDGYTCRVCKICANETAKRVRQKNPSYGLPHPNSKLTASDIPTIRERAANGESQRAIARDYGVIQQTISLIVTRKHWAHI